ncbi:sigma-70 family RNA polymerase sigma factor [Streptomyces sediminimaris]|uniref:sigma-70 family RNA polymerase sigma factor n=1 Tax=Streptomyces sediminimaris TaxID=3383721 RepID=UPI003999B3BE
MPEQQNRIDKIVSLGDETAQLRDAVVSHAVLNRAIGVVSACYGVRPETGREVLGEVSLRSDTELLEVARQIVHWSQGERLSPQVRRGLDDAFERRRPATELSGPSGHPHTSPGGRPRRSSGEELLHRMAGCPPGPERDALRERAVIAFLPVARTLARRYGSPVDSREDLAQVACLGLVKAIDGFDPARGHAFLSYAVPTIDGELKRHLRDHTWHVHVPRRIQDEHRRVRHAQEELRRAGHGDGGTLRDLQRRTGIDADRLQQVLTADRARNPKSMDEQTGCEQGTSLAQTLGGDDPALERVTDLVALGSLIPELPDRERRVLGLYFFGSHTQREIATALGISQMQVSRLLSRVCTHLRERLLAG